MCFYIFSLLKMGNCANSIGWILLTISLFFGILVAITYICKAKPKSGYTKVEGGLDMKTMENGFNNFINYVSPNVNNTMQNILFIAFIVFDITSLTCGATLIGCYKN